MGLRSFALGCALAASLAGASLAADEPTAGQLQAARELMVAAGASGGVDQIIPALLSDIRRQTVTRPDLGKDLEEVIKALGPELEQQRQQALNLAARAYAKWMPEADLRQAVAFFKSPAGQKYAAVQPDITDDVVTSVTAWSQLAAEYIQARVRAEMLKRGHQMQ